MISLKQFDDKKTNQSYKEIVVFYLTAKYMVIYWKTKSDVEASIDFMTLFYGVFWVHHGAIPTLQRNTDSFFFLDIGCRCFILLNSLTPKWYGTKQHLNNFLRSEASGLY